MLDERAIIKDFSIRHSYFCNSYMAGQPVLPIQRVIERLDEIHDEIMKRGKSKMINKVAGIIVTGDSDGAEHIIDNLTNFFIALGFTVCASFWNFDSIVVWSPKAY
jgi:hypothetical protein